jgi:colanic acid/amylovoran biosynthesis glycosyltransferase
MNDRRLRIAFVTDVFPRLSNTFINNQLIGLLDRGHEVDIFARSVRDIDRLDERLRIYRLERRLRHLSVPRSPVARVAGAAVRLLDVRSWDRATIDAFNVGRHGRDAVNLTQLYTVLSFLARDRYDVIHSQFGKLGPPLLSLLESPRIAAPLVVSFRGADLSSSLARAPRRYDRLWRSGSLFLPVSRYFRQRLEDLGAPPERIAVLHSGIETGLFQFAARSRLPGEPTRLLFVGRLTEKKGIEPALRATAQALAAGHELELTVVGDGELETSAKRLGVELGLGGRVHWLGALQHRQVAAALARAHLLIAPCVTARSGDQEGIPNVLKEAMASGLPVLSTLHSGIPELVEDGVSGFLVPERDLPALTGRLIDLIERPDEWPRMGRAGRAKVEHEFDNEAINDRLVELYRDLVPVRDRNPVDNRPRPLARNGA